MKGSFENFAGKAQRVLASPVRINLETIPKTPIMPRNLNTGYKCNPQSCSLEKFYRVSGLRAWSKNDHENSRIRIYEKIQSDMMEEESHPGFGNQTDGLDKTFQGHRSCDKLFSLTLNGIPLWALRKQTPETQTIALKKCDMSSTLGFHTRHSNLQKFKSTSEICVF